MLGQMWQVVWRNKGAYATWLVIIGALIGWGVWGLLDPEVVCRRWDVFRFSFRGYVIRPGELCNPDASGRWGTSYGRTLRANNMLDGVKILVGAVLLALLTYGVVLKVRPPADKLTVE